jgi:hypothetical protein
VLRPGWLVVRPVSLSRVSDEVVAHKSSKNHSEFIVLCYTQEGEPTFLEEMLTDVKAIPRGGRGPAYHNLAKRNTSRLVLDGLLSGEMQKGWSSEDHCSPASQPTNSRDVTIEVRTVASAVLNV